MKVEVGSRWQHIHDVKYARPDPVAIVIQSVDGDFVSFKADTTKYHFAGNDIMGHFLTVHVPYKQPVVKQELDELLS